MDGNSFWYGLLAVVLAAGVPSSAQSVVVTDLGSTVGHNCWANDINNATQIVGHCRPADDPDPQKTRGFVWNGTFNYLSTLAELETQATKINEAGEVIGWSRVVPPRSRGCTHLFMGFSGARIVILLTLERLGENIALRSE